MKILVIGAQNIDIFASLPEDYLLGDSNISKITYAFGGVGRNIAVNLNSLGNEVHFLTVFGDDFLSNAAKNRLQELKITISESKTISGKSNSTYLAILDEENDLYLGMNQMDIINEIDIDYIQSKQSFIDQFEFLVIDNNLSRDVIKYLLKQHASKTIFMDAVSAKKVKKLERLLPYIDYLKLNVMELQALTTEATVEDALLSPILNEYHTLLITNKSFDVVVATKHNKQYYTPLQLDHVVNASGAGDAFLSGFIHGVIHQMNQSKQMEYAFKLAHLTLQHPTSAIETLVNNIVEDNNE